MAGSENLGASFSIDITNLKAGLTQANRMIRESQSEFKAAAAGMDDWTQSAEGVTAKIKQLTDTTEIQETKVKALEEQYQKLIDEGLDPTSAKAVKLRTDINNEKAALAANKQELDKQTKALEQMSDSTDETATASEKLRKEISKQEDEISDLKTQYQNVVLEQGKESNAAKELERKIKELNAELNDNKDKLNDSEIALDDMGEAAEDSGDGFTVAKGAIAGFIANGLTALVSKIKDAIASIAGLAEETREFRQDMGTLETAFASAGFSAETATNTWRELYGIFGEDDRAVEAANNISRMAKSQEELNEWVKITTGIWGVYQDALPVEGLAEAAGETAKTGKVTGVLADALNWSSEAAAMFADYMSEDVTNAEDAFNEALKECTTEQERQALITNTLTKLYGKAADKYDETAASVTDANKAAADFALTQAELGEEVEPITTIVKNGFNDILKKILELIKKGDMSKFGKTIEKGFDGFINKILPAIVNGFSWIIEHGKIIISLLVAIGAGFAAFKAVTMVQNMVTAISGMVQALKAATTAQQALNSAQAANVIGAVVTVVVLLVEALVSLVKWSDEVVNGWGKMSDAIDANAAANERWQETMDKAKADLADYSEMTNAAGESSADLEAKMSEAQANITAIFQQAYAENRELRAGEIEAIHKFNQDYINAQQELADLQALILQAQTDSLEWQLNNLELSEEETQGILNTLQAKREEYLDYMDNSIAEEVALLDMRYQKGEISEQEYQTLREVALAKQKEYREQSAEIQQGVVDDALNTMQEKFEIDMQDYNNREHTFKDLAEISEYYNDKIKQIDEDATKSGWTKFWEKQALYWEQNKALSDMANRDEVTWTDYNFLTDQNISRNTQAFFNWIGAMKAQGKQLDETSRKNAKDIVNAYADLPNELKESGLNSLRGLALGMADEFPELENAATMDMETLIRTMNTALGNASPSKKTKKSGKNVMQGLKEGMEGEQSATNSVASRIANGLLSTFKNIFKEHSPSKVMEGIGVNLDKGLANGLKASNAELISTAKTQMAELRSVYEDESITASVGVDTNGNVSGGANGGNSGGGKSVTVYQTNNYSQTHSRYELYKSKQQTAAAVKLAMEVT